MSAEDPVLRVKLSLQGEWPILRQTPGSLGLWDGCQFLVGPVASCDAWVVYDDLDGVEAARCPPGRTLLVTAEPPAVRRYSPDFLRQFALVLTCQPSLEHPAAVYGQQAQPWHIGRRQRGDLTLGWRFDYDELSALAAPDKPRLASVISSSKDKTRGHRLRLRFVELLRDRFGDVIDVFGKGLREVEDKWEALAPYRHHIVLENTSVPRYWTEKLADPLLAWCHPIYWGCPDVHDWFRTSAVTPIDISRPREALATIARVLDEDAYAARLPALARARQRVLDDYNLFAVLAPLVRRLVRQAPEAGTAVAELRGQRAPAPAAAS